eukprot:scaffold32271_cov21-Tisochrysis_lutea.AAC.2
MATTDASCSGISFVAGASGLCHIQYAYAIHKSHKSGLLSAVNQHNPSQPGPSPHAQLNEQSAWKECTTVKPTNSFRAHQESIISWTHAIVINYSKP